GKIPQDRLPAAHVRGKGAEEGDLVSLGGKIVAGLLREAVLQLDVAAFKGTFGESRSLQRRLNVHLEIHEIRDELRVRLRLVPAAHDAERHAKIALLRKPRDDGVAGTLAAGQRVGRAGVQREERSAIVQRNSRAPGQSVLRSAWPTLLRAAPARAISGRADRQCIGPCPHKQFSWLRSWRA